jgi:predicted amidophosphoribosyltransferase
MPATPNEAPSGLLAQVGRAALGLVLDTALPPLCVACRQPVGGGRGLCAACWSKVSFIAPPYCERLGIPFAYDPGPGILSMEAIADPPSYGRARAAVRFDDVARDLVHALKYGDRLDLATTLGQWMARAGRELTADADALVPVPLHWRRLWARRFNQAAALAEVISKGSGAFRVPDRETTVRGRRLVLVDDVLTSGATLDTCARTLLRAGARSVDVLVFARVVAAVRSPI